MGLSSGGGENDRWSRIEELAPVVFADAKYIEAYLVSERDCFKQLAEMSRRIHGSTGGVNGCRYETVYADLHLLVIPVQAATRCWKRPAKAERTLRNTTIQSNVTTIAKGRPLGSINVWMSRMLTMIGASSVSASGT